MTKINIPETGQPRIVIVGSGPTGVEVAGALAEMKKYILPKDYPELNAGEVDIYLIQGASELLKACRPKHPPKPCSSLPILG